MGVIDELLPLQKGVDQCVKLLDVAKGLENIDPCEHSSAFAVGQVVARMHLMRVLRVEIVRKRIVPGQKKHTLVPVETVQFNDAVCYIEGKVAGHAKNVFHNLNVKGSIMVRTHVVMNSLILFGIS